MKVAGAILVVLALILALVLGVVPLFSDCHSQGNALRLTDGKSIPVGRQRAGRADLAVAGPLFIVGGLIVASRRNHVLRAVSTLGLVLGALAILLPTALTGVGGNLEMICNLAIKPTLVLAGLLVAGTSLVDLVYFRGDESKALGRRNEKSKGAGSCAAAREQDQGWKNYPRRGMGAAGLPAVTARLRNRLKQVEAPAERRTTRGPQLDRP